MTTLVNREAAIEFLVQGSLVASRCDPRIRDNITKARADGMRAQSYDGGSPSSTDPSIPVEFGPDGNILRDLTEKARKECDAGLEQAVAGITRYLAAARPYVDLDAVHDDTHPPEGWCWSHYRLDHKHEPVATGRYATLCNFCGEFRAEVSRMVKPRKLAKADGYPPTEMLERLDRYGPRSNNAADHEAAVAAVAKPLMPKRKKAS